MFLLVTDEDLSIYINHCCKDIREKEEKSHFGIYPKILSQVWYWWGVWETWWKSSMQTGKFLLVTDTLKRVRRKVLKKSSRPITEYWHVSGSWCPTELSQRMWWPKSQFQAINIYFRILQGYCWQVLWLITVNNPRTDIGKPVFMTDLQMHWYKLCDHNLENNDTIFDTIFGENNHNI